MGFRHVGQIKGLKSGDKILTEAGYEYTLGDQVQHLSPGDQFAVVVWETRHDGVPFLYSSKVSRSFTSMDVPPVSGLGPSHRQAQVFLLSDMRRNPQYDHNPEDGNSDGEIIWVEVK